jgi:hypothetical protein
MGEEDGMTRQALLGAMVQAWDELETALSRLSPAQWSGPQDAEGWSAKDHVAHMAAWGQSAVHFLQHKPRHTGLDIDESLYLAEGYDAINAEIQRRNKDLPVEQALAWLRSTHAQLLALVEGLSDADLARPYRFYLPDEPGEGDGRPAYDVVYGNSAGHYREHLAWIASLVEAA